MAPHTRRLLILLLFLVIAGSSARAQWERIPFGETRFWNEIFFVDQNHGWVTGQDGLVARTNDGGVTWNGSFMPGATFSFNRDICFLDINRGYVSGEDGVWRTNDGGVSWTNVTPPFIPPITFGGLWFRDPLNGVVGFGNGSGTTATFYRTADGGQTWTSVTYDGFEDPAIGGITYMNGAYYAVGGMGNLWTSRDDGRTWTWSNTGSQGWQEDIIASFGRLFVASANGFSYASTNGGRILRSLDGGQSWLSRDFPTIMWGVTMYSQTSGWVCGDNGRAWRTTDGGVTWKEFSCGLSENAQIDDIWFTDSTHGWAVGDGIYRYTLLATKASDDVTICEGDTTRLDVSGRGQITWSPASGLSCVNCESPTASPTVTTTYVVRASGIAGCEGVDSVTVTVLPKPAVAASGATEICEGDSVQLGAVGGTLYRWRPSASLSCIECQNPVARPTETTDYIVTAFDGRGCRGVDTVRVVVNRVGGTAGMDTLICAGESTRLAASGGVAYRWFPEPGLVGCDTCPDPLVRPEGTTTYRVEITGANGCRQLDSVTITVAPLPAPGLPLQVTTCQGEGIQLVASGGATYAWSPAAGLSCTDCPDPLARPDTSTTYTVVVTSEFGCTSSDQVRVEVVPRTFRAELLGDSILVIDTTRLGSTSCRMLRLTNVSDDSAVIALPWLLRNIEFSIPHAQLPLRLASGESVELEVCYRPTMDLDQRDTLTIPAPCATVVPLKGTGLLGYGDALVCDSVNVRAGNVLALDEFVKIAPIRTATDGRHEIDYAIGREDRVLLTVHDLLGNDVETLVDATVARGWHRAFWNADRLSSGLYFVRLRGAGREATEQVVVVR